MADAFLWRCLGQRPKAHDSDDEDDSQRPNPRQRLMEWLALALQKLPEAGGLRVFAH
jgi:hypothetical protein